MLRGIVFALISAGLLYGIAVLGYHGLRDILATRTAKEEEKGHKLVVAWIQLILGFLLLAFWVVLLVIALAIDPATACSGTNWLVQTARTLMQDATGIVVTCTQ